MLSRFAEKLSLRQQMFIMSGGWMIGLIAATAVDKVLTGMGYDPNLAAWLETSIALGIGVLMLVASGILGYHLGKRVEVVVSGFSALAKGDLALKLSLQGRDEFAWMVHEYNNVRKEFSKIVHEILGNASHLAAAAEQLSSITEQSKQGVSRQNAQTEQVATAMNEMSATVQEVTRNAANAAQAAQDADREAKRGQQVVKSTVDTINALAHEVEKTATVISKLKNNSLSIGAVLDVIRGIAEQTNLLALNAAIEAARAGEQGRGFAVVADEVRSLASRTQQSTQEIQAMIECLQVGANEAVDAMEQGRAKAEASVEQAAKAGESLESITRMVDHIKEMNTQIATAAEEQSATTEEINRNVANISEISTKTSQGALQTAQASDELARMAVQLQRLVGQLKLAAK